MKQYLELMQDILDNGVQKEDRTGTGTLSVFGRQMRFDLQEGFPLVTTKKIHWKSVVEELLWFISGNTEVSALRDRGVNIWNEWEKEDGTIGPGGYGAAWRKWPTEYGDIDQLQRVVDSILDNPDSRRHIVTAWNPGLIEETALPPCHSFFQFYVAEGKLSCQLYQRSGDVFLGIPFNIASYSLLTHMIAHVTGLQAGEFIHTIGDAHLYLNHLDQAREQLSRDPKSLPSLKLSEDIVDIDDFTFGDIHLIDYESHPTIKAPIAV